MRKFRLLNYLVPVCIVFVLLAGMLLAGCGGETTTTTSKPPTTTTTSSAPPTTTTSTAPSAVRSVLEGPQANMPNLSLVPQYGGTLKCVFRVFLSNIGAPWKGLGGPNKFCSRFVHEALTGDGPEGGQVPQLATDWTMNEAAKTITINLRQGVNFQDGTPFNAEAVRWNLQKNKDAKNPGATTITSMDIINDYQIVLHVEKYDPLFFDVLAAGAANMMVSPTNAEKWGDAVVTHPCGTGPFEIVSFEPDVVAKFKKNDNYWQKGLPYLDAVEVHMVADSVVAYTSFLSGDMLFFEGISAAQVAESKAKGFKSNFMISAIQGLAWDSVSEDSPFHDIRVRRAVAYAIDMNAAVQGAFSGMYDSTNQISAPGFSSYNSNIVGYPYNEAKALELIKEAGYGPDNPINCKFTYGESPEATDLCTTYQYYLAKIGINITLSPVSRGAWNSFIQGKWDKEMAEWNDSFQLPFPYAYGLLQGLTMGQQYPSVWVPQEYLTLFDKMYFETDTAKKEEYYRQINKMIIDDYCLVVPAYLRTNYKGVAPNLIDMGMGEMSGDYLPEIIWIQQ